MINTNGNDSNFDSNENFKQIEDVIDARKRLGEYNVYKPEQSTLVRIVKFDENTLMVNKESHLRHTDSEITIVKVKCTSQKKAVNKWDMNDIAIPGDGSHLGESPSMVNLVTLVSENLQCEGDDEYLVPLSSWDPHIKNENLLLQTFCSDSKINEKRVINGSWTDPNIPVRLEISSTQTDNNSVEELSSGRRYSWVGKFSKFLHRHMRKKPNVIDNDPETTEAHNLNRY